MRTWSNCFGCAVAAGVLRGGEGGAPRLRETCEPTRGLSLHDMPTHKRGSGAEGRQAGVACPRAGRPCCSAGARYSQDNRYQNCTQPLASVYGKVVLNRAETDADQASAHLR